LPEIYDYMGHPLLDDIEVAVQEILSILHRYEFSDQVLYVAQECLIDELLELEEALRDFKSETQRLKKQAAEIAVEAKNNLGEIPDEVKKATKNLYEEAERYQEAAQVLRYGRWLFRYIGDGIAWHAYGHDRRFVRALGSKEPVPSLTKPEGIDNERRFFRAIRRLGHEWLPIMHDITNCLRTADFSVFKDGSLLRVLELKIRKGKPAATSPELPNVKHDDRVLRQEQRLEAILKFMASRDLGDLNPELAGGKSINFDAPERHNFEAVSKAMAEARISGYGFQSPERGVLYLSWDISKYRIENTMEKAVTNFPEIFAPLFCFRSMNPRYEEYHQSLPITGMDLPTDDILDMLFGRLAVIVFCNFQLVEKYCSDNGVPLEISSQADGGIVLRVESEHFAGEVREGLWDRVMLEALSLKSFAALIRSIISEYQKI
jgi:hypothetical protein